MKLIKITVLVLMMFVAVVGLRASGTELTIGYSDWPGWTAWEIAKEKGFFEKHDVNVKLEWFEYAPSIDAFAAGKLDAISISNGDAMVLNATGARNIIILVNDYSNGNDKIVALQGINSVKDLKGKKVGVEIGCLSHMLLLKALDDNGMTEKDITLVNMPTHQAVQTLASREVAAIVAWQPNSGAALDEVAGSKEIYSSASAPGIIYDTLAVSPASLMANREEWQKVIAVWYDVIDFMNDPKNSAEVVKILAARAGVDAAKYSKMISGTRFLSAKEAMEKLDKKDKTLNSIYGSSEYTDEFFVNNKLYDTHVNVSRVIDPTFTKKYLNQNK